LLKTYVGYDDYVEILFQIVGPAEAFRTYRPLGDSPEGRAQAAKEAGDVEGQIAALFDWVKNTEREARAGGHGVAPRPYLEIAKACRKQKRVDVELAILERFDQQVKSPVVLPEQLSERLEKVRSMLAKRG
jgi:hypothetical protein